MLLFNNKTPKKINFNGKHVAKVIFNNVVVWLEKILTTITGYPITLTNSTGDDLVDYKIYGESQQGENLIDITNTYQSSSATGIDISNLVIGETYIFSSNTVFENVKISNRYNGYNSVFQNNTKEFTFEMARNENISSTDTQYLFLKIDGSWIADASLFANYDIQIKSSIIIPTPDNPVEIESVGDKVTDESDENYGKYRIPVKVNDNITNIYLNDPLRKIGDYADYIDFENQKVVRNVGNVDLGELIWKVPPGYSVLYYTPKLPDMNYKTTKPLGLCTSYPVNTSYGGWGVANTYEGITINVNTGALDIKDTRFLNNANSFKEANKGNYFYYLLTTPTEETIELPTISTNKGTNIIEVDTSILPSNMEVQYYSKGV